MPLQYFVRRDPVHPRALHRHRFDFAFFQPLRHPFQLRRCGSELFHLSSRPIYAGSAHPMDFACQVNGSHVGSNHRQPFHIRLSDSRARLLSTPLHPATFTFELESPGWPNPDSGLGESYWSLANV